MNLSANQDWRLVHRLDASTSGVMVVAAAGDPAASVAKAFAHGRVRKEYRALVSGVPSTEQILNISSISEFPGNRGLEIKLKY